MAAWVWYAILAATTVISYLTAPKPESAKPATRDEFSVPNSDENKSFWVVFGTVLISDASIVKDGDYATRAIKAKGGKK